jgi:hypothetical protein
MVNPNSLWLPLILCIVCFETYEDFVTFYLSFPDPFAIDGEVGTYYFEISNMESSPTMVFPNEEGGEAFILRDLAKCMNECGLGILTRDLSNQECGSVCLGACYGLRTLESL